MEDFNFHTKLNEKKIIIICIQNWMRKKNPLIDFSLKGSERWKEKNFKSWLILTKPLYQQNENYTLGCARILWCFWKKWFWMEDFHFNFHSKLNEKKIIKIYIENWMRKLIFVLKKKTWGNIRKVYGRINML